MAHTTTLRAQGATRASDARFSSPCSSRACMYFISPARPAAIQLGKYSNSRASAAGATPASSKPDSKAASFTIDVRSGMEFTADFRSEVP